MLNVIENDLIYISNLVEEFNGDTERAFRENTLAFKNLGENIEDYLKSEGLVHSDSGEWIGNWNDVKGLTAKLVEIWNEAQYVQSYELIGYDFFINVRNSSDAK